jgi:hypothetical protein
MNPTHPAISLHHSLHRLAISQRRRQRLLVLLFFLLMAGGLVFLMSQALTRGNLGSLVLLVVGGGMMLVALAVVGGLIWRRDRRLSEQLQAADCLLRDGQPQDFRLVPVPPKARAGILVELHPRDGAMAPTAPVHALIHPACRWSLLPPREIAVQVYGAELKPGRDVVALQADGEPLLGKLVDRDDFVRRLLISRLAMLAVLGAALAGILVYGFSSNGLVN